MSQKEEIPTIHEEESDDDLYQFQQTNKKPKLQATLRKANVFTKTNTGPTVNSSRLHQESSEDADSEDQSSNDERKFTKRIPSCPFFHLL